jgi:SAM-dependent methyltransferase
LSVAYFLVASDEGVSYAGWFGFFRSDKALVLRQQENSFAENIMADDSRDFTAIYQTDERAHFWAQEKLRRQERSGAATETLIKAADLHIGDRVLEVAAGTGDLAVTIAQSVGSSGHVVAVDISANMLAHAEKAAREAGLSNIETCVMDAGKLDFEENSFKPAICRMALMLFQDPLTALTEMHRVVKLGGKVAVMVWSSADRNPFHGLPLQIARSIGNIAVLDTINQDCLRSVIASGSKISFGKSDFAVYQANHQPFIGSMSPFRTRSLQ